MGKGLLYFARNPAFRHLIKIGQTTKDFVEDRGLTASNVPEDFDYPKVFVCEDIDWVEKKVHEQFSEFRHTTEGNRKTEFFWSGCLQKAIEYARDLKGVSDVTDKVTEEIEIVNQNGDKETKRLPRLTFEMIGLAIETKIFFNNDPQKIAIVKDNKNKIEYNGKIESISAVASSIFGYSANGFAYFYYNGVPLLDMRPDMKKDL